MIRLHLFLLGCVCLLLVVGCGGEEEMVAEAAHTPTQLPVTGTPMETETETTQPTPTPSATLTLATHTPTLPPPTNTPTTTPQPTETATNTPIPLPPPPGEIYFFLYPDAEEPGASFYRAIPGTAASEWNIETILTGMSLEGPAITVSPDQTKLALLLLDDTDGDGELDRIHGGDVRNIYIYNLLDNSLEQLTNNEQSTLSVSWLPDSSAVTYPQSDKVLTTTLDGGNPRLLFQLPEDGHLAQLIWSLDGQELIAHVNARLTGLREYEPDSDNFYPVYETSTGNVFFSGWSPGGRWLAFTHYGAQVYGSWRYVAVMNKESLEVMRLVFGEDYMSSPPDWSMDSQWLAFTKNESVLSLWNAETLTVTDILSGTNMSIPIWSPLENRMALALVEAGIAKVLTLTPQGNTVTEVFQSEFYQTIKPFAWSPDGEWLLTFAGNEEQSGLYAIHVASGISYLVMDTTGGTFPRELVWLSTP